VSTADATDEDIKNLYGLPSKLFDETKENYSPMVHYMVGRDIRASDDEDGKTHEAKEAGGEGR